MSRLLCPSRIDLCRASIAAIVALATGCSGGSAGPTGGPPPVPVRVGVVERRTMPVSVRAVGTVEPIETVAVRARVGGELVRVWFAEGQRVRRGETLFTIDDRPFATVLAEAEARLERDRAQLVKAEADIARYADLVKRDFVTREQFDQIMATAEALRATVKADEAAVASAQLQLDYCTIVAPVSGRTGSLQIRQGNLVKANDDQPMVTIHQIQPIHVRFELPSQFLNEVQRQRGDGLEVEAAPGAGALPETGTLVFIDNAVNAGTGTVAMKALFANADEVLWPGQYVDVTLRLGEEADRVVAPATAVQSGQQGSFVYVVGADDVVEMRPVTVDRADEETAVIASGLDGGETVVTDGHLRLVPGARVRVAGGAEAAK